MGKKGACMGYCGDEDVVLHHDPRSPPMDFDPCLCIECAKGAYEEEAERLNDEAQNDGIEIEVNYVDPPD
jgi:hypothetical protein